MVDQPISKSVILRSSEDHLSEQGRYFEDRENWRNIIFLPYKMLWRIMIVCTILLDCLVVTYSCSFSYDVWTSALGIYYVCECVYFVDFILVVLHRYMIPYQKTQTYLPKNSYFLLIDALTLLPYYETYYILQLSSKGRAHMFSWDYTRLKVFLRIFNIIQFFYTTDRIPGLNHILVTTLTQMVIFFLYQIIVGAFLYSLRFYSTQRWTDNLQYHNFNNMSAVQWLILTNTMVGNVLAHNWSAIIKPENAIEVMIFGVTMILGFLMHIMIFFGQLTALYIKRIADQFIFSARLEVIAQMLDDWKIDKKIKFDVMDKYNAFWEKMCGEKNMPPHFYTLPKSLQGHCAIDIFWHCFKHSQLFNEMDMPFLKNLSLWMKNEFYMPGEYIYYYNQVKTKMIYIVSGVLEVVGQDARASSIISFSGGTVLGEISILMLMKSKVHLRCATYCKLQTLEIKSLLRMTRKYHKSNKYLQNRLKLRFTLARELQHAELVKVRNRMEKRTSVKWLKQQWRSVYHDHRGKTKTQMEERYQQITVYHTSRFLGLYVLSDEVELKKKIICLKSTCPYLLEPSSSFKVFCDYLILVTIGIQTISLPYMCFFRQEFGIAEIGWFYILDLLYVFGIYLDLSTVIEDNKKVISNLNLIIIYKGKQVSTLIDIFSTLPLELLSGLMTASAETEAILRLNRVLRIYKIFKVIGQRQLNVWVNYLRIRLIKYALLFFYILYFLSCLVYGMSCYHSCDSTGWLAYNILVREILRPHGFNHSDVRALPLLVSIDYAASRLLSLTYGYRYAYSMPDIIMEHFMILLGYYMFSYCFAELAACAVLQLDVQSRYQKFLQGLSSFANRQKLPTELRKQMYNLIHCRWHYNKRYEITGPDSIMKDMPENLRNDILLARIVHCLKTLALFVEAEDSFLWDVARVADLAVYPEGTVIIREDMRQSHMYVILRGHCAVESCIPTDKYHKYVMTYSYGDSFPVLEMLHKVNSFLKVTAITTVEIMTIPLSKLMTCIKGDERFYADLKAVIADHMDTYYMVLTRQKGRLPEMHSTRKARGKGEYFEYTINDRIMADSHKLISAKTYDSLGHWSMLRYFLLRDTFEPTGKLYTTWELIRSAVSVAQVMYILFFMKFHLRRKVFWSIVRLFLDAVLAVDVYVRMHVRYYDQRGIQITHPWYTLRHYVKTSFFLDLFLILPLQELQLHTMFGQARRYHVMMLMYTLIKPFLLHRTFNGLYYLQETSKQGKAMLYHNIRYVGLVLVVFGMFSSVLELLTCWETSDGLYIFYECPNDTWIKTSIRKTEIAENYYTASIISLYAILSIFATCTVGLFKFETSKELTIIFFITAGLFALRWFVLAKITSSRISGNRTLVHYQHNMKIFLAFMKKYCHRPYLVQETVAHNEFVWKKTKGYPTARALRTFHIALKGDLMHFLYANALNASYLLHGTDATFISSISTCFEEAQFRKDAEIIRCNDINAYIYLVYKGEVDILVANDKLCTLTIGGMFGCFSPTGNTRQTITARAKFNVDVLQINNTRFNEIVLMNQKVKQKMTKERFLKSEYILPTSNVKAAHLDTITYESVEVGTAEGRSFKAFLISPTNPYYQIYDYIVNVHLATLSSLLITTVIVAVENNTWEYYVPIYILDGIFLSKLLLGFHVTYMDPYSGLYVTQFSVIWRKYAKSMTGFWLDIGTLLPFELLAMPFVVKEEYLKFLLVNKTLRFVFLIKYYTNCKNTLTVSRHLRWTYLMYIMVLLVHLNTCIWWLIACPNKTCSYYVRVSHEPYSMANATDTFSSFRIAYLYVINVFSSTGLKMVTPTSSGELIATIIMVCVAQYILVALTAGFASMLVQDKSVMTQFEREAGHVLKYLEATNLSLSLKNKVWNYYIMLWTRAQGPWLPELVSNAPSYLKEDIMKELYGVFLQQHFLFKKTHVDFLRQLVAQLELCVFLPGMYITTKGTIDNSMYFIEEGEVVVYELNGKTEVEILALGAGKSFGEPQGLYSLPHDKTYKARFTTRILILHKKNWYHLLQWFPASKEQIEEQAARRLRMQTIKTYYA